MKTFTTLRWVALGIAFALASCAKKPEQSQQVNEEFTVGRLFTYDGCTVYRFYDAGYARYFTNCRGDVSWRENCGKNCWRDYDNPTKQGSTP